MDNKDKKITIYVMTHQKFTMPTNDPIYVPLHCGAALPDHPKLPYKGDNTGDNISKRNLNFCELSGQYWAWKNDKDSDIMGLVHYHRFFVNKKHKPLNRQEVLDVMSKYDCIINGQPYDGPWTDLNADRSNSVYSNYKNCHHGKDFEEITKIIKRKYPKDYQTFYNETWIGCNDAINNTMICTREIWNEYSEWLFSIFFEYDKYIDMHDYDDYNKRVYGFLSERMQRAFMVCRGIKFGSGHLIDTDDNHEDDHHEDEHYEEEYHEELRLIKEEEPPKEEPKVSDIKPYNIKMETINSTFSSYMDKVQFKA